jgi:type II secretory ATPase GspE/PulE/Tfp pilus assembly ATPase PilB-like protein
MTKGIWEVLGLRRATLDDLSFVDKPVATPPRAPLHMAFGDSESNGSRRRLHTLDDWRSQEPAERIVNTVLLCAIRDGARQIIFEPYARGVHVKFVLSEMSALHPDEPRVRDHMKLPLFAHEPVIARVKSLAHFGNRSEQWGLIRLHVDETAYDLHVSTQPTPWGERVELRFC